MAVTNESDGFVLIDTTRGGVPVLVAVAALVLATVYVPRRRHTGIADV